MTYFAMLTLGDLTMGKLSISDQFFFLNVYNLKSHNNINIEALYWLN